MPLVEPPPPESVRKRHRASERLSPETLIPDGVDDDRFVLPVAAQPWTHLNYVDAQCDRKSFCQTGTDVLLLASSTGPAGANRKMVPSPRTLNSIGVDVGAKHRDLIAPVLQAPHAESIGRSMTNLTRQVRCLAGSIGITTGRRPLSAIQERAICPRNAPMYSSPSRISAR